MKPIQLNESISYPQGYNAIVIEGYDESGQFSPKRWPTIDLEVPPYITSDGLTLGLCTATITDPNDPDAMNIKGYAEHVTASSPNLIRVSMAIKSITGIWYYLGMAGEDPIKGDAIGYLSFDASEIIPASPLTLQDVWVEYQGNESVTFSVQGVSGEMLPEEVLVDSATSTSNFLPQAGEGGDATITARYKNVEANAICHVFSGMVGRISVTADPSSIKGSETSTITAQVSDRNGLPLVGWKVNFAVIQGPGHVTSDEQTTTEAEETELTLSSSKRTLSVSNPIVRIKSITAQLFTFSSCSWAGSEITLDNDLPYDVTPCTVVYDTGGVCSVTYGVGCLAYENHEEDAPEAPSYTAYIAAFCKGTNGVCTVTVNPCDEEDEDDEEPPVDEPTLELTVEPSSFSLRLKEPDPENPPPGWEPVYKDVQLPACVGIASPDKTVQWANMQAEGSITDWGEADYVDDNYGTDKDPPHEPFVVNFNPDAMGLILPLAVAYSVSGGTETKASTLDSIEVEIEWNYNQNLQTSFVTVADKLSYDPVPGATARVGSKSSTSDSKGRARYYGMPEGDNVPINISADNYKTNTDDDDTDNDTATFTKHKKYQLQSTNFTIQVTVKTLSGWKKVNEEDEEEEKPEEPQLYPMLMAVYSVNGVGQSNHTVSFKIISGGGRLLHSSVVAAESPYVETVTPSSLTELSTSQSISQLNRVICLGQNITSGCSVSGSTITITPALAGYIPCIVYYTTAGIARNIYYPPDYVTTAYVNASCGGIIKTVQIQVTP